MPSGLAFTRLVQHNQGMTTLQMIDGDRGETRSEAVARRLRGTLAESQISHSAVGRLIGLSPSGMSRRMTGKHPWDLNELSRLEEAFGIDLDYVLTGRRNAENPHQGGPGGGEIASDNGLKVRSSTQLSYRGESHDSNVIPMRRQAVAA